jgi:3-hydroxypropanoate dehydrogenase
MTDTLSEPVLDQLFRLARTRNGWTPDPVSDDLIHQIYDVAKWGPTAANSTPARFVFVTSTPAKEKLVAVASGNNKAKIMAAPVTVIIGYDLDFPETLPKLFPHAPNMKDSFKDPVATETAALRNSSLQGAYLMIAARALGLDCGPMSGFDNAGVNAAFFAGTRIKSNFICSLGHGTDENLFPRLPRHTFDEACKIV